MAKAPVAGAKWLRKAADQKFAAAQLHLGVCYFNGLAVAQDQAEKSLTGTKHLEEGDGRQIPLEDLQPIDFYSIKLVYL